MFIYPTEYDSVNELLYVVGQFWQQLHIDETVIAYVGARGLAEEQAVNNFDEFLSCASRFQIPYYHTVTAYPVTIANSLGVPGPFNGARQWLITIPPVETSVLQDAPASPQIALFNDIDYIFNGANIVFLTDPFLNPNLTQVPVYDAAGNTIDTSIQLWFSRPSFEIYLLYEQYGYAINFTMPSSQQAKDLMNQYFNAIVSGTAKEQVERAISYLTGIPLAFVDGETVELITSDSTSQVIITDQNVYRIPFGSVILVSPAQILSSGQALCDALQFFDCNRGQLPTAAQCPGVILNPGMLIDNSISGPLTFQNESLPVIVTTVSGKTMISLALGGNPSYVSQFWSLAQTRGAALGATLAELLDTRTIKVGEPTAANLPAALNPLQLIMQNILRYSGRLCVTKSPLFPSSAPGISQGQYLRQIILPNEIMLIVDITAPGIYTTINAAAI